MCRHTHTKCCQVKVNLPKCELIVAEAVDWLVGTRDSVLPWPDIVPMTCDNWHLPNRLTAGRFLGILSEIPMSHCHLVSHGDILTKGLRIAVCVVIAIVIVLCKSLKRGQARLGDTGL